MKLPSWGWNYPYHRLDQACDSCRFNTAVVGASSPRPPAVVLTLERRFLSMEHKYIFLALAGALGTLARYSVAGFVQQFNSSFFPFGTLVVNISGCFAAGFLWTLFESRWAVSGEIRTCVLVGFMGAFTTFSAFILETGMLVRSAEWFYAVLNLLLQNCLGLLALGAGIIIGRLI